MICLIMTLFVALLSLPLFDVAVAIFLAKVLWNLVSKLFGKKKED